MVFEDAIKRMKELNHTSTEPACFVDYLKNNSLSKVKTSDYLSPQGWSTLKPELKYAGLMIFRLGARRETGNNAYFSLAKWKNKSDFIFFDENIFKKLPPEPYVPTVPLNRLFAFHLLPGFTETSFVNLVASSGLLAKALNLDNDLPVAPATGKSIYSFSFKPFQNQDLILEHKNGQVEIDAVFTARRNGVETLFVVEAKFGKKLESLVKNKLAYPALAMASQIPTCMPIVPIYLRGVRSSDGIHVYIGECKYETDENGMFSLDSFNIEKPLHYLLLGVK